MCQIYQLITCDQTLNVNEYSEDLQKNVRSRLSPFLISGAEINLVFNNGVYTVDAVSDGNATDLMTYGHILELFLTVPPSEFDSVFKTQKSITHTPEIYSYGQFGETVLRSQLDAQNPTLPKVSFDLKTRALLSVRKDMHFYKHHMWYEIDRHKGLYFSFERERYDMLRSAFLKYR